jgi:hypothetical protein
MCPLDIVNFRYLSVIPQGEVSKLPPVILKLELVLTFSTGLSQYAVDRDLVRVAGLVLLSPYPTSGGYPV